MSIQHVAVIRAKIFFEFITFRFIASFGFVLSLVAAITAVLSGVGARWGWWHYNDGFLILEWAAYAGLGAAMISLAGAIGTRPGTHIRGFSLAVAGLAAGLLVAGVPWHFMKKERDLPRIHDITTDTRNPPQFEAILSIRKRAPNKAEYGGPKIAALQRQAYPDIQPFIVTAQAGETFERALKAARRMGWMIVDANRSQGRIEATATTFWFGFKEDVVVRIKPLGRGSRMDVRSVSRISSHDRGANAARVRAYLQEVKRAE